MLIEEERIDGDSISYKKIEDGVQLELERNVIHPPRMNSSSNRIE